MNRKLLIIDNLDSFTWNLVQLAKEAGAESVEVISEDKLSPRICDEYRKILISPGPGLPADYPRMLQVVQRYSENHSILGICLGHQAIAACFGASLFNMEQVAHGISRLMFLTEKPDPVFDGLTLPVTVGLYHSWSVSNENFPDSLNVTGISEEGMILSFRHQKYDLRGFQFHPESIMTPDGLIMIRNWMMM